MEEDMKPSIINYSLQNGSVHGRESEFIPRYLDPTKKHTKSNISDEGTKKFLEASDGSASSADETPSLPNFNTFV
jgi:hypothetical protein